MMGFGFLAYIAPFHNYFTLHGEDRFEYVASDSSDVEELDEEGVTAHIDDNERKDAAEY